MGISKYTGYVAWTQLLEKPMLDSYLSYGWFRAGRGLFKKVFLQFNNHFYNAFWLRYDLSAFTLTSRLLKIKQKNQSFKVVVQPITITDEKVQLYEAYKASVPFEPSDSLENLLYGSERYVEPIFDTYEVLIYDYNRLIGFGFFDIGEQAAAGINAVYDPDYKKYSLGKFIILQKLLYCKSKKIKWFYPGYVAPGYPAFDYKLFYDMHSISFFDFVSNTWKSYEACSESVNPIQTIQSRLQLVIDQLPLIGLQGEIIDNPFYDLGMYLPNEQYELIDVPQFIALSKPEAAFQFNPVIYWDIFENCYKCVSYAVYNFSKSMDEFVPSYQNTSLKESHIYFKSGSEMELLAFLKYLSKFL